MTQVASQAPHKTVKWTAKERSLQKCLCK